MRSKVLKMVIMSTLLISMIALTLTPQKSFAEKNEDKIIIEYQYQGENGKWLNKHKEKIKTRMDQIGIDKSKQKGLLQKMANGQLMDSDNPEKVEEIVGEIVLTPDEPAKKYVFEDGSILEVGIEKKLPEKSFDKELRNFTKQKKTDLETSSLQSVSPYSISCGSGYCNYSDYEISATTTTLRTRAMVSFSIVNGTTSADSISSISNLLVTVYGGSYSDKNYSIPRRVEDVYNGRPAEAHAAFVTTYYGSVLSSTVKLRLLVGKDKFSVHLY